MGNQGKGAVMSGVIRGRKCKAGMNSAVICGELICRSKLIFAEL